MNPVVLEDLNRLLLFIHLVAGITCVASSVHLLLRSARAVRGGGTYQPQVKLHAVTLSAAYLTTVFLGGLIYPVFRVHVRLAYLDAVAPWATGLFEIKELMATLGVIPVLGILALSRVLDFRQKEHRVYAPLFAGLAGFVMGIVTFNAWCGWYLGTLGPA